MRHMVFVSTTFESISNLPSKGFSCLCFAQKLICSQKFVLKAQTPYIKDLPQFFNWAVAPKNWSKVSEGERKFLVKTKDI